MALSHRQLRAVFAKLKKSEKVGRYGRELKRTGRPSWRGKSKKEKALYTAQWISAIDTLARPARWVVRGIRHRPGVTAFITGGGAAGGAMASSYGEGGVVDKNSKSPAILQRREHARKLYRRSRRGKSKRS